MKKMIGGRGGSERLLFFGAVSFLVLVGGMGWWLGQDESAVEPLSVTSEVLSTEVAPPDTDDPFILGQFYFNHDDDPAGPYDLGKARQYFNQALEQGPKSNPLTWYQLGRIDFLEGKFDSALYKFEKQKEHFGDQVPAVHYMVGLAYGYKARQTDEVADWVQGEEAFLEYIDIQPDEPWPRVDLAWIYFAQGKYEEMIGPLETGLLFHPENAWLLNMHGLALLNTGEHERAKTQFLHARDAVALLTTHDWGLAYPGNNPADWAQGLREFQGAIEKNLALVSQ